MLWHFFLFLGSSQQVVEAIKSPPAVHSNDQDQDWDQTPRAACDGRVSTGLCFGSPGANPLICLSISNNPMVKHSQHSHIHCDSLLVSTVHLCSHIGDGNDFVVLRPASCVLNPSLPLEFAGRPIELFQLTLGLVPAQFRSTIHGPLALASFRALFAFIMKVSRLAALLPLICGTANWPSARG